MKKYSCNLAQKGKTAYRTPQKFIYQSIAKLSKNKAKVKKY